MGHFELQNMLTDFTPFGEVKRARTEHGVAMLCPKGIAPEQIARYCELARKTPGYPVDVTLWNGTAAILGHDPFDGQPVCSKHGVKLCECLDSRMLVWAARLHYRMT